MVVWQIIPVNPARQLQLKLDRSKLFEQVPPFWQGSSEQGIKS